MYGSCMVHYGSCTVQIQFKYSPCTVHVQFKYSVGIVQSVCCVTTRGRGISISAAMKDTYQVVNQCLKAKE